jgi:cysteinyl-tRNA synthetase
LFEAVAARYFESATAVKPFQIHNTLSRRVEELRPLNPSSVTYYSCGPTVYLPQHLGNLRAALFVDTLRRALEFNGYAVRHVMNVTDVGHMTSDEDAGEDKIEKTARAEGKTPREVADFYLAMYRRDCERLNIKLPPGELLCRATDHIPEMLALIERIIERGYAYVASSGVYFDVEKYRGANRVGRLSAQSLDEQATDQRLEHSADKKSPHDFALWMLNQPAHLMQWPSPWGRGYPGWHIECSAMSMKYLGETIDLHSGGTDHIPIHHENEIAQSESATGKEFVRCFVHNAFLIDKGGAKISKSAGKFPLLDDLVAAGIDPLAFRLLCFSAKYRSELVFSDETVRSAQKTLDYIQGFAQVFSKREAQTDSSWTLGFREQFRQALNDDLNTPEALAAVLALIGEAHRKSDFKIWSALREMDSVLGLDLQKLVDFYQDLKVPPEIQALVDERLLARTTKDFKRSDELRRELIARGWEVKDLKGGTTEIFPAAQARGLGTT